MCAPSLLSPLAPRVPAPALLWPHPLQALFRRGQLKALVDLHGTQAGFGGTLSEVGGGASYDFMTRNCDFGEL